ncbi:MAG: hypothetical protein JRF15_14895 [Deltaproteobacteria bacterium]|nr:hypothetical protein [Deltaproteobacteria bacterium]
MDPKGEFRLSLSHEFSTELDEDGDLVIEIPMSGSDIPMYCFVWRRQGEIGVTALRAAKSIFAELEKEGFEIADRRIAAIESGSIGETAYQSIAMTFTIDSGGEKGTGLMKSASANSEGYTLSCNQFDAGYAKTFNSIFSEFVDSFRVESPKPAAYYKEISQIRLGDLNVGIMTGTFNRDAEGDIVGVVEASTLLPRSESEFLASYSKTTDWMHGDGTLINAYEYESDTDSERVSLALKWNDEKGWAVSGIFQGKDISTELNETNPLDSMLSEALAAKYQLAPHGKHTSVALRRWIPDVDPTKSMDFAISVDAEDPQYLTVNIGGLNVRSRRDAVGLPELSTIDVGGTLMTIERIYQDGEI